MIYKVFAREKLADPIGLVGEVDAEDETTARDLALDKAPDSPVEVTIVPADVVHWVIRPRTESEAR